MDLTAIAPLATGFAWGLFGQGIRAALGLRKWAMDPSPTKPCFDWRLTASSLIIGGLAGITVSIIPGVSPIGMVAGGYAGADGLEGLIGRFLPGGSA